MYKEKELIEAISQSFKKYIEHGSRSTEKLKPINKFVAKTLQKIFGATYQIHFLGDETK